MELVENLEFERRRVVVDAHFAEGLNHCVPVLFTHPNGREVMISEVGLWHPKYDGIKTRHIFDVTDGGTDYRLELDSETLIWYLSWEGDNYD